MDDVQQLCLRWRYHQSILISVFNTLLENETLVDCTLAAEGKFLKAHKVVLSACSPYFATLLQEQYDKHPIFILKDVKYQELRAMMDFMYRGEVNIARDQLDALFKAAESLQIKGLSHNYSGGSTQQKPENSDYTLEETKRARITSAGAFTVVPLSSNQQQQHQYPSSAVSTAFGTTLSSPKKTDIAKGSTQQQQQQQQDAINTDNVQDSNVSVVTAPPAMDTVITDASVAGSATDKLNYKQQKLAKDSTAASVSGSELVIESRAEYDDEANDVTVKHLISDEEDMGVDDLDQNAGTSQGGEGSSQGYAPWKHDRSQNHLLMTTQEAQQRNPQDSSMRSIVQLRYLCTVCGKSYLRKANLKRHITNECIGVFPKFPCAYCENRYKRKEHLRRHMGRVHNRNVTSIDVYIERPTTTSGMEQNQQCGMRDQQLQENSIGNI